MAPSPSSTPTLLSSSNPFVLTRRRLGHEASLVKFDPSRERFFMVVNSKVGVHQSEDSKLLLELDNGSRKRILCASPGDSGILFTAGEDPAITASDTNSGKLAYSEV
ncbi:Transducin/WD40 repeat-like superfamily protein [Raphanus sativus]|nr:Transducin/WD40 repeat-like superfamily protein [Raphanus sativus]